jgi:hypothetical protein
MTKLLIIITELFFPVDIDALPGYVNPYDPALGGINCLEPCTHTGNGTPIEGNYGLIAACHPDQYGCWVEFSNDYGSHGPYQCNDTGGMLLEPQMRNGQLIQYYDVLLDLSGDEPLPWWNNGIFDVEVTCYD